MSEPAGDARSTAARRRSSPQRTPGLVKLSLHLDPSRVSEIELLLEGRPPRPVRRIDHDTLVVWLELGDEVGSSGLTAIELLSANGRQALLEHLEGSGAQLALRGGMPPFALPPGAVVDLAASLWTEGTSAVT